MCLIAFSYKHHPEYDLILVANRDEYYERPTRPAQFWNNHPDLLAGKDLQAGGTWLGITRTGRIAALTNYRAAGNYNPDAPTRGTLPLSFLTGDMHPKTYMEQLQIKAFQFNGFNLLAGKPRSLYYLSNKTLNVERVQPGVHGLSNHLLDTPWPKVEKARSRLERITNKPDFSTGEIFEMLLDQNRAPEPLLPDTGVGPEKEKELSPIFIETGDYGTRSSALLLVNRNGIVQFTERYYRSHTRDIKQEKSYTFELE